MLNSCTWRTETDCEASRCSSAMVIVRKALASCCDASCMMRRPQCLRLSRRHPAHRPHAMWKGLAPWKDSRGEKTGALEGVPSDLRGARAGSAGHASRGDVQGIRWIPGDRRLERWRTRRNRLPLRRHPTHDETTQRKTTHGPSPQFGGGDPLRPPFRQGKTLSLRHLGIEEG